MSRGSTRHLACTGLLALVTTTLVQAQERATPTLPELVISATRTPMERQQVAASIDLVDAATIAQMGPQINLSEALQRVPGLAVLNRQNYAQDLQISSRGFGARSPFGVRGVRLYADGIPATMPDGQGQSALFDLGSAERIEVLRGPASVLYGNASGGVVQVFTQDGPATPELKLGWQLGRDGLSRPSMQWGGESGQLNYMLSISHFETDGWRQHSAAQRDQLNAKLAWALSGGARLSLVANYLNMPDVQDPLGLDAAGLAADPSGVASPALAFDTRKHIENAQVGAVYERPVRGAQDTLRLMAYAGTRQVQQFQAIPVAPQRAAAHPGGVIDFARAYAGLDARYTWRHTWLDRPLEVTAGINLDDMHERRQGYQNFVDVGLDQVTGVQGALKRQERNRARNNDQYMQGQWALSPAWLLGLGVRHSRVALASRDAYIEPGNGDDSGALQFSATTPAASLMYTLARHTSVYVSAARSFETPTLGEVAYHSSLGTSTGWNRALQPSRGEHVELGIKSQAAPGRHWSAAVFHVDTDDEIGVQSSGGRSVYRNVGRTGRHGAEGALQWRFNREWQFYTALSWTSAHYQDASSSGTSTITPGHHLPGVPVRQAFAELSWRPAGQPWHGAVEWRHTGRIWANDANDEYAPASSMLAWRLAWRHALSERWALDALARIDNLGDQPAVGSVIVNEGNRRYFEPSPGRSLLLGITLKGRY